jgi:two-component system cell cycle sensor histidine kinase/response regulator CckA
VERVPGRDRATVEASVQAEGFPGFEFKSRALPSEALQRAPVRPEHFIVRYTHPYLPNKAALGFDLYEGRTWPELQRGARENILVTSGSLPLITDGSHSDWGYLLELPVYHLPIPRTADERWASLRGFVLGIFRPADVVGQALREINSQTQSIDLLILDRRAPPDRQLLYATGGLAPDATPGADSGYHTRVELVIPGRSWEISIRATPAWVRTQRSQESAILLFAGLLGTGLLGVYLRATLRRTELVEHEVSQRTEELRRAQDLLEDDIRRRTIAEEALRRNEANLQAILDHSPNAIFVKDLAGHYVLVNRQYELLWNRPAAEILGRTDFELFPAEAATRHQATDRRALEEGSAISFDVSVAPAGRDGPLTVIVRKAPLRDAQGQIYGVCCIATDITERKAAEEHRLSLERQLLQSQKLESMGVLAGGIAHDFNNILTSILGNATLASLDLTAGHPAQTSLRQIENASRRAADLCAQMLAYAGKARFIVAPVNLTSLVRDTAALLEVSVGRRARLELRTAADLPAVQADATQLRQIVMNLVINAADALGERSDGHIILTTAVDELAADFLAQAVQAPALPAGRYVRLEISDNGSGMPPDVVARIFEPFFTTKFSGRGLGLSAVLGIVQSHHGALFVDSTPGRGTTFRLYLPATNEAAPADAAATGTPAGRPLRGTVLVVDDEESVRFVAMRALAVLGVEAHTAADGETALQLYRAHPAITLVLLDLVMPGLSGEETLARLRQINPEVRVVVMSGYSEGETMQRCAKLGVAGFLPKPFDLVALRAKLLPHLG